VSPDVLLAFRGCRLYAVDLSFCQGLDDRTAAAVVAEHASALQLLNLGGVALGDAGMVCRALGECSQLRTLSLSGCAALTDSCITCLQGCGRLEHLDLSGCMVISGDGIGALAQCRCLRSLDLSRCRRVSNLAPLASLPLRSLRLGWTAVDDNAMSDVASMSGLETLVLDRTGATDQGVTTACGACTRLSVLSLSGCAVTSAIGAALAPLRCLREVSLDHTRFCDTGIASWCSQPQPQMRALSMSRTAVTSTSLLALGQAMGGLEVLNLDGCRCSGEALRHLRKLRRLNVADTLVTDADVEHICSLPSLEALNLAFCAVTSASLRRWCVLPAPPGIVIAAY
jgi:F-box/leucine-rich repeat protein 14